MKKITVIGLGKLGLCTAACFAANGVRVVGVEKNERVREALRRRECPIAESGLAAYLDDAWENFSVTDSIAEAVASSDAALIIVPTPSEKNGRFTNTYLASALREIAVALRTKKTFFVVDVVSTVMPGSCECEFMPLLEKHSGKRCGKDFGLVYNPEFIALGTVLRDFLNPDMVLIGASDARSSAYVEKLYRGMVKTDPQYAVMSLVNAEITKLSLNCFCTMKISFANEIAALCERIGGADASVITAAIGADSRVGKKYIKPGLGFGGPCFPRDNQALQACGKEFGYGLKLSPQVVKINKEVPARLCARIVAAVKPKSTIGIVGLAYKPGTHIIEESQAVMLIDLLLAQKFSVVVYDPLAMTETARRFGDAIAYAKSAKECAKNADLAVRMFDVADGLPKNAPVICAWR